MIAASRRAERLAAFYASHHKKLERIVARRVRASDAILEDACQTAWVRLCARPDIALSEHGALSWLVTTATREAWKHSSFLTHRERPVGVFLPDPDDVDGLELPGARRREAGPVRARARTRATRRAGRAADAARRRRLYLYELP